MSNFPSFIHDTYRPGPKSIEDGRVWLSNRERLERIIHGTLKEAGARYLRYGTHGAKDERTMGDASVVYADRAEPPMTAEEARRLGESIVTGWTAMGMVEEIPEFCDTVFTLPE